LGMTTGHCTVTVSSSEGGVLVPPPPTGLTTSHPVP
jgi:hypothetical protein